MFYQDKSRRRSPLDFPQSARIPQRHSAQFPPFRDAALRFGQIITPVGRNRVVYARRNADLELVWHRKRKWRHYAGDGHALKCGGGRDILA